LCEIDKNVEFIGAP